MNHVKIIDKNKSKCILHWKYLNNKYKQLLRLNPLNFVKSIDFTIQIYNPILRVLSIQDKIPILRNYRGRDKKVNVTLLSMIN